jgi:hypothetical protein
VRSLQVVEVNFFRGRTARHLFEQTRRSALSRRRGAANVALDGKYLYPW